MTYYVAIFSDDYVAEIKNSRRRYTHAWRVTAEAKNGKPMAEVGFAGSRELAAKASGTVQNRWRRTDFPDSEALPVRRSNSEIVEASVMDGPTR